MHHNPNLIGVMTWPLTPGRMMWRCNDRTRPRDSHVTPCHEAPVLSWISPSLAISNIFCDCELHWAKRHDSLACPESQCSVCPPHMWWWTLGAKVTHHPMPRTLGEGGETSVYLGMCIHIMGLFTMARYYRETSEQQLTIIGLSSPFHNLTVSRHWYGDG